jgi:hypothetical protein
MRFAHSHSHLFNTESVENIFRYVTCKRLQESVGTGLVDAAHELADLGVVNCRPQVISLGGRGEVQRELYVYLEWPPHLTLCRRYAVAAVEADVGESKLVSRHVTHSLLCASRVEPPDAGVRYQYLDRKVVRAMWHFGHNLLLESQANTPTLLQ